MTITTKKNGTLFPSLVNDFFEGDNWFPEILNFDNAFLKNRALSARLPSANIIETGKNFKIELAAPGLEKKDFNIAVEDGYLTIFSEKEEEKKEDKKNFMRREFSYNAFTRSFKLPENCLPDQIEAKYDNGILHLAIPKKEMISDKPKKAIQVL